MSNSTQMAHPDMGSIEDSNKVESNVETTPVETRRNRWADEADDFDSPDFDPLHADEAIQDYGVPLDVPKTAANINPTKVHVYDLDPRVTEQDIIMIFSPLNVKHCKIVRSTNRKYSVSAAVFFYNTEDVQTALTYSGKHTIRRLSNGDSRPIKVALPSYNNNNNNNNHHHNNNQGNRDVDFNGVRSGGMNKNYNGQNNTHHRNANHNYNNNRQYNNYNNEYQQNNRKQHRHSISDEQKPVNMAPTTQHNNNSDGAPKPKRENSPDFSDLRRPNSPVRPVAKVEKPVVVQPCDPPAEPSKTRTKLQLKPRTKPLNIEPDLILNPAIFGGARPVCETQNRSSENEMECESLQKGDNSTNGALVHSTDQNSTEQAQRPVDSQRMPQREVRNAPMNFSGDAENKAPGILGPPPANGNKPAESWRHNGLGNKGYNPKYKDGHYNAEKSSYLDATAKKAPVHVKNVLAVTSTEASELYDAKGQPISNEDVPADVCEQTPAPQIPSPPAILRKPEQKSGQNVWEARAEVRDKEMAQRETEDEMPNDRNRASESNDSQGPNKMEYRGYKTRGDRQYRNSNENRRRPGGLRHGDRGSDIQRSKGNMKGDPEKRVEDSEFQGQGNSGSSNWDGENRRGRKFRGGRFPRDNIRRPGGKGHVVRGREDRSPKENEPTVVEASAAQQAFKNSPAAAPKVKVDNRFSAFCEGTDESD